MPRSLKEFVSDEATTRTTCWVCNAPPEVRLQVEGNEAAPRHARLSRALVAAWSKEEYGYTISIDSIYRHTRDHV